MSKAWYVLHTYSGYEGKIERTIRMLMEDGSLRDAVYDIKVPSEKVVEVKDGKKKERMQRVLPGYILLEMDLPLAWKPIVAAIRKIQGVTGFVGTSPDVRPQPISAEEARNLLQRMGEIKGDAGARMKQSFSVGEKIKIINGPFESFTGSVEEVHTEKSKLKVMVEIFGRNTPVELDFLQVEKL
jgi:transcription termination/antitermination protein NusG